MKTIDEMDVQELREAGYSLPALSVKALNEAQTAHRPHSLIGSHRFWQQVASAPGVAAWGYAYEGGEFNKRPFIDFDDRQDVAFDDEFSS